MPIKIPSKNIFNMSNSKYNNNEIGKVTFEQNYYTIKEAYPKETSNETTIANTVTSYSDYVGSVIGGVATIDRTIAKAKFSKKTIKIERSDELILSTISVKVYLTSSGNLGESNLQNKEVLAKPYNGIQDLQLNDVPTPNRSAMFEFDPSIVNKYSLNLFETKVFYEARETTTNYEVDIYYLSEISFVYEDILGEYNEILGTVTPIDPPTITEVEEKRVVPKITEITQTIKSMQRTFEKDVVTITNPTVAKGKTDFTLSSNELMQDKTTISGKTIGDFVSSHILNDFSLGKQTSTILCSIDDYYDENGNLVICAKSNPTISKPMTFRMGDEVIPCIYTKAGKDVAMSKKPNNSDMVFKVIGIRIYQRGVVMQELELVEI